MNRKELTLYNNTRQLSGVYAIHTPNGVYVGQSSNISRRWAQHMTELIEGRHHNKGLAKAFRLHKLQGLQFQVLRFVPTTSLRLVAEIEAIDDFKAQGVMVLNHGE